MNILNLGYQFDLTKLISYICRESYSEEAPSVLPGGPAEEAQPRGSYGGWAGGRGLRHGGPSMGLPPPPQVCF